MALTKLQPDTAASLSIRGVRASGRLGTPFAEMFAGQFILSETDAIDLPGWRARRLDRWVLHCGHDARLKTVHDRGGRQIGWFLGEGVGPNGVYIGDRLRLPCDGPDQFPIAEKWIEGIAGRWVMILDRPGLRRVYGDPVGDYSLVYNPRDRLVAPSLLLAISRPVKQHDFFTKDRLLHQGYTTALQQTLDRDVLRALPNHYLDLDSFQPVRHWPRPETTLDADPRDMDSILDKVSERLSEIVGALADNQPVIFPISGGNDSRNLLGAAQQHLYKARFGFAWRFHKMSRLDSRIAEVIARRLRMPFQQFDEVPTTRQQRLAYLMRTGYSHGGTPLRLVGTRARIPPGHLSLRGNIMELLRANQWNGRTIETGRVSGAMGLRRLLISRSGNAQETQHRWAEAYDRWVDTLPANALCRQLDMGFIEHLLPNSLGIRHFGQTGNFVLNPFADRRLIEWSMSLPPDLRKENRPNAYLNARNCAQLADIPFVRDLASGKAALPKA